MSERDRYPAGVPCWVETLQPDPRAALEFYGPLFEWQFEGPGEMPGDPPGEYFVARVRGRDVAGIGSRPAGGPAVPAWTTYVRVGSADKAAERAAQVGGSVQAGPFDAPPAGRMAVLADPAGAAFCVWEAGVREGAQVVNEPRAWSLSLLHTSDPEGSKAFYGALFGWEHEPFGGPDSSFIVWRLPGYVGGEPQQPVPRDVVGAMAPLAEGESRPHWSVDFWVDDADRAAKHAEALGGRIVVPLTDTPGFRSGVISDPLGAEFSISQRIVPGAS
jgi:predicted enzyme related to lactoylglutathione lyase